MEPETYKMQVLGLTESGVKHQTNISTNHAVFNLASLKQNSEPDTDVDHDL